VLAVHFLPGNMILQGILEASNFLFHNNSLLDKACN
jgi:hypothetical protein